MKQKQAGFTLIELVIVIILLGIIGATITPRFVNIQDNARQAVTDAAAGAVVSTALLQFAEGNGTLTSAASVLLGIEGVGDNGGCGGATVEVEFSAAFSCAGGAATDVAFTVQHCDDSAIQSTGSIPAGLCDP